MLVLLYLFQINWKKVGTLKTLIFQEGWFFFEALLSGDDEFVPQRFGGEVTNSL